MSIKDRIHSGDKRTVYLGDQHVVKVPNINYYRALPDVVKNVLKNPRDSRVLDAYVLSGNRLSLKWILTVGWSENRREARLSKGNEDLLMPTEHSLGMGLVNIMDTVPRLDQMDTISIVDINKIVQGRGLTIEKYPRIIDHPFIDPSNFGVHNDQVKILDYGSAAFEEMLIKERKAIEMALAEIGESVGL